MPGKKKGFKRRPNQRENTKDDRGIVVLTLRLREKGTQYKRGNITKTISITDAKVSEVYFAIERALFGKE